MKQLYTLLAVLAISAGYSQNINFPDAALKAALLVSADSDSDGEITQDEAAAAMDIFLSGTDITDPSGLEYFTGVSYFYMTETSIASLDISFMTDLYDLDISDCANLTSLTASGSAMMGNINVSSNTVLQTLSITDAQEMMMDINVSDNPMLTSVELPVLTNAGNLFQVSNNDSLMTLSIPQLQTAMELSITQNPSLTTLDLSDTSFTSVAVSGNGLTSIDITNMFVEAQVDLSFNALTSLDLSTLSVGLMGGMIDLSGNNYTQLEPVGPWTQTDPLGGTPSLTLNNTQLTTISFSQPVILNQLIIQDNQFLQTLSFRNNEFETCQGGYCSIDTFLITGNTALTMVCTDPFEVYALETQNYVSGPDWIHQIIGPEITVNTSGDCDLSVGEHTTQSLTLYPNPTRDQFTVKTVSGSQLKAISIYNIVGQTVKEIPVAGKNEATVSTADLQSGTYIVNIETNMGRTSKKLVKL